MLSAIDVQAKIEPAGCGQAISDPTFYTGLEIETRTYHVLWWRTHSLSNSISDSVNTDMTYTGSHINEVG
jgi:hypothetical protein